MDRSEEIKAFYLKHLPGGELKGHYLKAPCPLCRDKAKDEGGTLIVRLDPESYFSGYFRCLNGCVAGGFPLHFGRVMGIDSKEVPGYDPDREPFVRDVAFPAENLTAEVHKYQNLMDDEQLDLFQELGIARPVLDLMNIGYNGRYLFFPYPMEDGNHYAGRCIHPRREEDNFWHGDEAFFSEEFRIYNLQEIERCEDGALFITDGEFNLLTLQGLGYPGIAAPSFADLEVITPERLSFVRHVFLWMRHTPEAQLAARSLAIRLGFKARIIEWPLRLKRGYDLRRLALEKGKDRGKFVSLMLKRARSFSPFTSPEKEHRDFCRLLDRDKGKTLLGLGTGFEKMDHALNGLRGINIMGGQPKAGKSCFFMQISAEIARQKIPVIYYDFENGRQKIYMRTLCRMSRLSEREIRLGERGQGPAGRIEKAQKRLREMLPYFRVVTDRKLGPDLMRRKVDYLQNETRLDTILVVVDSLHKLPFKDLSERRTGIDEWLRHMEAIRDEQNVTFLVISELSRGLDGTYGKKPDLGSFKESGDIEYSADNAMILLPDWDPLDPISTEERKSTLWLVASRENSPGKIAEYVLDYPYWGFVEK